LQVFLDFTLALAKGLEQEHFLFRQCLSLLFQILLSELQNVIFFLNDFVSIFQLFDFFFELSLSPIEHILLR